MSDDIKRPGTPGIPFYELSSAEQAAHRTANAAVIDLDDSDLCGRASTYLPARERNVPLAAEKLPRTTTPPTIAEIIKAQRPRAPKE